jgi:hypothetical protein
MVSLNRSQLMQMVSDLEKERDEKISRISKEYEARIAWAKHGAELFGTSQESKPFLLGGLKVSSAPTNVRMAVEHAVTGASDQFTLRDIMDSAGKLLGKELKIGTVAPYLSMLRNTSYIEVVDQGGGSKASVYRKTKATQQRGGQVHIKFAPK